MDCYNLMGIVIRKREENAVKVQEILTKYGCMIKVRLGLHEVDNSCSEEGFIVLQLCGGNDEINRLRNELNLIEGVSAEVVTIKSEK